VRRAVHVWSKASGALLLGASLLVAAPSAAAPSPAASPRSVLLLYGFDPFAPAVVALDTAFRSTLGAEGPPGVVVHDEILDAEVVTDPALLPRQRAWLRARYGADPPAVVVAAGLGALEFVLHERDELWPDVPVVFTLVDEQQLSRLALPAAVTGVARQPAVGETLELALRLFPDTRRLALVSGAGPADRALEDAARRELERMGRGLEQVDLTALPLAVLGERMATLPPDTVVLGVSLFRDGAGRSIRAYDVAADLTRRSTAPAFTTHGTIVGLGVVGGWVSDYPAMGVQTGRMVNAVLARAPGAPLPPQQVAPAHPVVDARQLERWHVPERRLPEGTEVLFRDPSLWRRHRALILGVAALLVVESLLIAFLLLERRRRQAAEAEALANQERIAHMNRVGTIAELSGSLAHELNGPLGSMVNNARAAKRLLAVEPPRNPELRASLEDIESAAERASQVIRKLRVVLRKDEFRPGRVEVATVMQDAVRLVRSEAVRRRVLIEVGPGPGELAVSGDEVLLLQILLNLLLNALDAVMEKPAGERTVSLEARTVGDRVELSVSDSGPGFPESARDGIFEPFFTTKPQGLGMGLAICRSIAETHGGEIVAENRPEGGAVVRVTLPISLGSREAAA
jgi:signal transduction histidine kinase